MGVASSQQHLSPGSVAARNSLPEKGAYAKGLRIALYQHDRHALQQLTGYDPAARQQDPRYRITPQNATPEFLRRRFSDLHPSFTPANVSIECLVELVEKRWDAETVRLFLSIGLPAASIATLLGTCVVRNHYPALHDIIRALHAAARAEEAEAEEREGDKEKREEEEETTRKQRSADEDRADYVPRLPLEFVKARNLHHLFPIVCHQNEEAVLMAFVEAGLFDPHSPDAAAAALRIVAAASMRMHARALQRYGNAILAPLPPISAPSSPTGGAAGTTTPAATAVANPNNAPEWFVAMLKETQNEGLLQQQQQERVVGDGVTAAPIGTHHAAGATPSASSSSSSSSKPCPLSDAELAAPLLDPSTRTFTSIADNIAPFIAPLIYILSSHAYPTHAALEAIKAEALRTAAIRTKGARSIAGWEIYERQRAEVMAERERSKKRRHEEEGADAKQSKKDGSSSASASPPVEISVIPLLSPVASILALADGSWTPDTHRMHTPAFRRSVRTIYHTLAAKKGLSEDDVMGILSYLPEGGVTPAAEGKKEAAEAKAAGGDGFEEANEISLPTAQGK